MMLRTLLRKVSPPAVEQRTLHLAEKHIHYTLKRSSKRRSIGLRIDDRGLTVSVPLRATDSWLQSVLQEKADWVVQKLDGWQTRKPASIRWAEGERIPFRGEQFTLRLLPDFCGDMPKIENDELHIPVASDASAASIEKRVAQWYRREALSLFEECVAHYAPLLGVSPREVKLSSARTQWGSCTVRGVVRLNWRLVKLPLQLIDYVVVHELAHLVEMNHSPAFWRVVQSSCPEYAECRKELHGYGIAE